MDAASNKNSSSSGKAVLYVIIFFLLVIAGVVGYFYYTMSTKEAEADEKLRKLQADTAAQIQEANLSVEREKAKLKASQDSLKKQLNEAGASVRTANKLKADAAKVKAYADKKKREADAAMKKAIATRSADAKKLADAKKKAAAAANAKVKVAQAKAKKAIADAKAKAKTVLNLKKMLDTKVKMGQAIVGTFLGLNAAPGTWKTKGTVVWGGWGPSGVNTANRQKCQQWAASKGLAAWGHSNEKHGNKKFRNKCFGYKTVKAKHLRKHADSVHTVGCTFSDLRPDQTICPPKTPYPGLSAVQGYYTKKGTYTWGSEGPRNVTNPVACQKWAAGKGYPAWGYRNNAHPTAKYKKTCFGYKDIKAKHTVNPGDNIHVVGCTFSDLRPDEVTCPK